MERCKGVYISREVRSELNKKLLEEMRSNGFDKVPFYEWITYGSTGTCLSINECFSSVEIYK